VLIRIASRPHLPLLICTPIVAPPLPSLSCRRYLCRRAAATFLDARPLLPSLPRGHRCLPRHAAAAAFGLPPMRCCCVTPAANALHCRAARRRRAAAHRPCAADTLPPRLPRCRRCQCCAAAKLPLLPPLLTFQLSLMSLFLSPLRLPLLVDC
jgi:hypothetical protein